jgi:hypothetical protein
VILGLLSRVRECYLTMTGGCPAGTQGSRSCRSVRRAYPVLEAPYDLWWWSSNPGKRGCPQTHSRTRDRKSSITRERVKPLAGTRAYSTDLSVMPDGRHSIGRRRSGGEVSCRIHCIEQNVAVISRTSVAPSLHFALPQPKYEPAIRGWHSITARWLRPRNWACWLMGISHFDNSDLTDGV